MCTIPKFHSSALTKGNNPVSQHEIGEMHDVLSSFCIFSFFFLIFFKMIKLGSITE